jgi:hypothetical protein
VRRICVSVLVLSAIPLAVIPLTAWAQADDGAYCAALSTLANRYLVSSTGQGNGAPDLDVRTSQNECAKGNFAKGIPVLERKLRSNGFTLPKRQ